jgi:hypothetical protein
MEAATSISASEAGGFAPENRTQFRTVILYEDLATGTRAKRTLDQLAPQFGAPSALDCQLWSFNVLADAQSWEEASAEAVQADLVILSAHASSAVPGPVRNWIYTWLSAHHSPPAALAVTFDDCVECERTRRAASPVCAAFRQAASLSRLDFVCTRPAWQKTTEELFLHKMMERAHGTSSVLEGILRHRGVARWGLNE